MIPIAALKIGAAHELIYGILRFRRYLRNISRELPGEVERSLSPPCVCVRNHGGRAAPLLPLLYPLLAYAYFIKYVNCLKSEEWTFLACVSLGRPCSQLSCNSMEHCSTRFQNKQECRINSRCGLHSHGSRGT